MNPLDYLTRRVDDQIAWYSEKGSWNQRWYKRLRAVEIVCAAAIPLLVGFVADQTLSLKVTVGLLGFVVAIITGIVTLYRFQENWVQYRATAESLKHEKFLFLTRVGPYAVAEPFPLFVQRIEQLIAQENSSWAEYTKTTATTAPQQPRPDAQPSD